MYGKKKYQIFSDFQFVIAVSATLITIIFICMVAAIDAAKPPVGNSGWSFADGILILMGFCFAFTPWIFFPLAIVSFIYLNKQKIAV